jgi:transglutaminase-like putative cysteine protease
MSDLRRYRIAHHTSLRYSDAITASHNELRMTPLTEAGQTTLDHRLRIRPMTWSHVFQDYWGSHVTAIDVSGGHDRLDIDSLSTVERDAAAPTSSGGLGWGDLRSEAVRDALYEWLTVDTHTLLGADLVSWVAGEVAGLGVAAGARRVFEIVAEHLDYRPGATAVHSSAEEAWVEGGGVCQDYAHVAIGLLRPLGIPARYVSGYLAPRQDGDVGETTTGESHAWVEWWDGAWNAYDPTNTGEVGLDHVVVGRGRDYRDVPPLVGVFSGAATSSLEVRVAFTRLA